MKGLDLIIRILIPIALALFIVAGLYNYANSLSEHHMTLMDPILYACILAIYTIILILSFVTEQGDRVLNKLFGIPYRLKHGLRWCAAFFGGVIIFGVNSEMEVIRILHLVFTALAIITGYTILWWSGVLSKTWSIVLTIAGAICFSLGFIWDIYSVTWAEFLVALPITYGVIRILKEE
jgi:hypothetical protein